MSDPRIFLAGIANPLITAPPSSVVATFELKITLNDPSLPPITKTSEHYMKLTNGGCPSTIVFSNGAISYKEMVLVFIISIYMLFYLSDIKKFNLPPTI